PKNLFLMEPALVKIRSTHTSRFCNGVWVIAKPPAAISHPRNRCSVERGEDRPKAFLYSRARFGVREDVKLVIANSSQDSPCHLRRVHASADPFGKPSIVRVRRVHWCRWAITLGAIASALQDVGADDSRTQDAHADAERLHLHGEPLGHADDGILGCRIGREALPPASREFTIPAIDAALTMCPPSPCARTSSSNDRTPLTIPTRFISRI